jgi:hypothetical protein
MRIPEFYGQIDRNFQLLLKELNMFLMKAYCWHFFVPVF